MEVGKIEFNKARRVLSVLDHKRKSFSTLQRMYQLILVLSGEQCRLSLQPGCECLPCAARKFIREFDGAK